MSLRRSVEEITVSVDVADIAHGDPALGTAGSHRLRLVVEVFEGIAAFVVGSPTSPAGSSRPRSSRMSALPTSDVPTEPGRSAIPRRG